jgi:hypothetical protein
MRQLPITAIALLSFCGMACSSSLAPLPASLAAGLEYGGTIPLSDIRGAEYRIAFSRYDPRTSPLSTSAWV